MENEEKGGQADEKVKREYEEKGGQEDEEEEEIEVRLLLSNQGNA